MKARFVSIVVAAIACATPALGQEAAATAEALFREARELAAQGKYDQACPKYAASQRLHPGFGTLYNLGDCLAKAGPHGERVGRVDRGGGAREERQPSRA